MIGNWSTVTISGGLDGTISSLTTKTPDQPDTVLPLEPPTVLPATSIRALMAIEIPVCALLSPASGPEEANAGIVTIATPEATCTEVTSIETNSLLSPSRAITRRSPGAMPFCRATATRKPFTFVVLSVSSRPESSAASKSGVPGIAGGFKFTTASELT